MIIHAGRPARETTAAFWLDRLKGAHSDLLSAIGSLAELAHGPLPDEQLLISIRWKVSEASLSRRLLWGRIHAYLSKRVDAAGERHLRELQDIDVGLIRASVRHVSKWSVDAIMGNWTGYCHDADLMMAKMVHAIGAERRILYPILSSLGADDLLE